MKLPFLPHWTLLRLVAPAAILTACVSPPIGSGPTADERLEAALSRMPVSSSTEAQRLGRDVRGISLDHPHHVPTLIADAALSMDAGDGERAMSLLDQALALEPDNVDAAVLAVGQSVRSGDVRGAQRRLDQALRLRPDHPDLYEASASIQFVEGRYSEALLDLDRAEALLGERSWRNHYHRALVAESQGNVEIARVELEACLALAPGFQQAQRRLKAMNAQSE